MKKCFRCGELKRLNEFYKHSSMSDGHLNKCKNCTKQDVHNHRTKNIERIREYDRNRPNHKERIENNRKYSHTKKGKEVSRKAKKKYVLNHPDRRKATSAVSAAIRSGKLIKQPCEKCGNKKAEAHHDDYSKPFKIKWLCDFHHKQRHKELRAKLRKKKRKLNGSN